jgi:hypothetical protein
MPSPDFSRYIDLTPLDPDPAVIYNGAVELARLSMPEFTLRQGTPEDAIFQAVSYITGITAGAINRLPSALMVGVANLLGYSRYPGSKASVEATLTLANYDAAVISAGTILSWSHQDENGEVFQYAFEITETVDIAAGTPPTLPTGTATLRSLVPGYLPTLPVGTTLNIVTTNTAIQSAVTTDTFINGTDPETDRDYMDSVATYIQSLSSTISTATQVDSTILTTFRNVGRCKTYDLTNPSGDLYVSDPDEPGYSTIFTYGRNAQLTTTERDDILLYMEDKINVGLALDVLPINVCGISVRASIVYDNKWLEADIIEDVEFTLNQFLGPDTYPTFDSQIRANIILARIARLTGIVYVSSLALQPIQTVGAEVWSQKQWADVRCATTGPITIATGLNAGDVIDGITLVNGDRVLVKDQSTASQNGIYIVSASPARATDADASAEFSQNKNVYVTSGSTNAATYWKQTTSGAITVGTTSVAFGSSSGFQTLDFVYKGSMPDISLGSIDLTMTGETV